jgi:hypothetical protein
MELAMLILVRIFLTMTVFGYAFATIKVDLNKTHAANPQWTPHARFHVVWQVLSYTGIGLIELYLIWIDGGLKALLIVASLSLAVYAAFFAAVLTRPLYAGSLYDANGYPPFRPPIGPPTWRWDANVTVFTCLGIVLAAALAALVTFISTS